MIDDDERRVMARRITNELAAELKDSSWLTFEEDGDKTFLIVSAAGSVLHYDLYFWVELLIKRYLRQPISEGKDASYIHYKVKVEATHLIVTVNSLLKDALWILENISHARLSAEQLGPFYTPVQVGLKVSTLSVIDARLRHLLDLPEKSTQLLEEELRKEGAIVSKRARAITDSQMIDALRRLERFSIKALARNLAPDEDDFRRSVYDWLRQKKITRAELETWWRHLRGGGELWQKPPHGEETS